MTLFKNNKLTNKTYANLLNSNNLRVNHNFILYSISRKNRRLVIFSLFIITFCVRFSLSLYFFANAKYSSTPQRIES